MFFFFAQILEPRGCEDPLAPKSMEKAECIMMIVPEAETLEGAASLSVSFLDTLVISYL